MIEIGQLKEKLVSIRDLPTFPSTALEVMRLASDADNSAAELSRIISKDPPLAVRILKVANSPYYGFARKISTIEWAIVALGFETLRETVLSLTLIDLFRGAGLKYFDPRLFWRHAEDTASASRAIAKETRYRLPGEAYTAGLLHDIGTLVLYKYFGEDFEEIQRLIHEENVQQSQAELAVIGASHGEVGAWLANRWSFPPYFVEAIRYHHTPAYAEVNPTLISIVHIADQLACVSGYCCSDRPLKLDYSAIQLIGIEKLGVSLKSLADKYISDDISAMVKVHLPADGSYPGGAAGPFGIHQKQETQRQIDDETLRRFFKDAIKLLPSAERLVLTLKLYEGLELHQVASVLGYEEAKVAEDYSSAISVLQQMAQRAIQTNRLDQWKMSY